MKPERWKQVSQLYEAARTRPLNQGTSGFVSTTFERLVG